LQAFVRCHRIVGATNFQESSMSPLRLSCAGLAAALLSGLLALPSFAQPKAADGALVGPNGMTLYTFDKDEAGKSNCYDKCATNWPPLKAEADAKAEGEWTVIDRTDGTKMWAYDGHPLYTFVKDKKAGDATGEGVGGVWHIAKAD